MTITRFRYSLASVVNTFSTIRSGDLRRIAKKIINPEIEKHVTRYLSLRGRKRRI
jgi:hypothetical protein